MFQYQLEGLKTVQNLNALTESAAQTAGQGVHVGCNASHCAMDAVKPGGVDGKTPHIAPWIVVRETNYGLRARLFCAGDDHAADPLLSRRAHRNRQLTPFAAKPEKDEGRFDICLQGDGETVYLDM